MHCSQFLLCLFGISVCFQNVEAILGGDIDVTNEVRYYISILTGGEFPKCGGGIIKENFVITAASCVIGPNGQVNSKISVRAETTNLDFQDPYLVIPVQTIFVPKMYSPHIQNSPGDIAILKLKENLELQRNSFTSLDFPRNRQKSEDNQTARISGIGWVHFPEHTLNMPKYKLLRYAKTNVRTHNECKNDHRDKNITPHHLCARVKQHPNSTERRGVCIGDEGGPLVRGGKNVIGILSMIEVQCSEQHGSGIYTRTVYHRAFKKNAVGYTGPEGQYTEVKNMRIFPIHV